MPRPIEDVLDSIGRPSLKEIEQAIASLVAEGLVMDSGRRRFNERTGRLDVVWVATEHYKPPEAFAPFNKPKCRGRFLYR
jgi:hypothetical protein